MLMFVAAVSAVLIISFLCSIFESVLLSITRPQIELMISAKKRTGRMLARFKENMDVPIAAILILNTAAHTIGAAVAGASYTQVFGAGTLWIFSIIFTLAVLLFTEIIPKTLGVSYATVLASPVAHGINTLSRLLWPLVVVSEKISQSIRGNREVPVTSAEEIRLLAVLGNAEGAVGDRTAGMIVGAAQLQHLQIHDVLLPRERVHYLSERMSRDEVASYMRESGYSRFPLSPTEHIDDVAGMVLTKHVLDWLLQHPEGPIDWQALVQDILIVPESLALPKLLRTFQESRLHMALVVDEYGSVEGIATLEDVLEEVVGDIRDESDDPAEDILENPDGSLTVKASVDLRQLSTRLGLVWQPEFEVTSVGGLISETLERIPKTGDSIVWHDYRILVTKADRRRVRLLTISKA